MAFSFLTFEAIVSMVSHLEQVSSLCTFGGMETNQSYIMGVLVPEQPDCFDIVHISIHTFFYTIFSSSLAELLLKSNLLVFPTVHHHRILYI
jgi:hypothetical protein